MRIGFFGDGKWARLALENIEKSQQLEVVFIVARHGDPDMNLQEYAKKKDVPFIIHSNVNEKGFLESIQPYRADIFVSMSFDQIIKPALINAAPSGFINCHAGNLPFYRGRNVLNWAIINDEDRFGVTVHFMDEGIDTGDIILQRFDSIDSGDTYATVLQKASVLCASTLYDALIALADGTSARVKQSEIHPVGAYRSRRKGGDEWIDWNWSSERIFNLVRSITPPGPSARTWLEKQEIALVRVRLIPEAPAYIDRPGTVVGRNDDGVIVKTGDSTLLVTSIGEINNNSELEIEYTPTFKIGTILGINVSMELKKMQARLILLEQRITDLSKPT